MSCGQLELWSELMSCGPVAYFLNMWNVMDWINFAVFFLVWWTLRTMFEQEDHRPCALLCQTVGFQDDWQVLATLRAAPLQKLRAESTPKPVPRRSRSNASGPADRGEAPIGISPGGG